MKQKQNPPTHMYISSYFVIFIFFSLTIPAFAVPRSKSDNFTVFKGAEDNLLVIPQSSPAVKNLKIPKAPPAPYREIPKRIYHTPIPVEPPPAKLDPLLNQQSRQLTRSTDHSLSTLLMNFDGQGYTTVNPPDTVGDVGLTYYIQAVNSGGGTMVNIYAKSDGSTIASFTMDALSSSGNCTSGFGDPVVLYDQEAGRWLLSEFSSSGNNLCVYISQTSDPTGSWWAYAFTATVFPDYPKYGVWSDAYYVSTNESSPTVYALERSKMISGQAATMQKFILPSLVGFGFQAVTPADLDGPNAPPTGAPGYFMRHRDDEAHNAGSNNPSEDYLEVWELSVDWTTPANSTLTKSQDIATAEFDSDLCGLSSFTCFAQPGTATLLDPLREIIMHRLQYRNFGSYETLVGNFVTDVSGTDHGGIRWFELRKYGMSEWSLYQEGTLSPDSADRWMGAISMDGCGNIALGYNVVDEGTMVFPGIRYAGRLVSDTPGIMTRGEYTVVDGGEYNNSNRYGDYSAMSIDPVDDRTFWFTGEYNPSGASHTWHTRIAAFKFDTCESVSEQSLNILFMIPRMDKR